MCFIQSFITARPIYKKLLIFWNGKIVLFVSFSVCGLLIFEKEIIWKD
ncbi:hypothetical protein MFERI14815_00589 [Mycoplasma feriruminatoris]|nr:hypothetical protein MFERI14815_00589 [Mycoplasma feriruminatoris]